MSKLSQGHGCTNFIAHWLYGVILIFLMEQNREVAFQKLFVIQIRKLA